MSRSISAIAFFAFTFCISCQEKVENPPEVSEQSIQENTKSFISTLEKHLDAVSNRDLETLAGTLSPTGEMYLILPQTETTTTVDEFLEFQDLWFQDTIWTFETEILHTAIEENLGIAIVDAMYREPERNGAPYFNHMQISYTLRKEDGTWYVIKDHASSIERTGDR